MMDTSKLSEESLRELLSSFQQEAKKRKLHKKEKIAKTKIPQKEINLLRSIRNKQFGLRQQSTVTVAVTFITQQTWNGNVYAAYDIPNYYPKTKSFIKFEQKLKKLNNQFNDEIRRIAKTYKVSQIDIKNRM